jgi:hypothetical protein
MPRGDGKGPPWGGGRGTGRRVGMGGSRAGAGPGGECVCPKCGATVPHETGIPCFYRKCPKCGEKMVRK